MPSDRWVYSRLWGKQGKQWQPGDRLPDFSYAGYHVAEMAQFVSAGGFDSYEAVDQKAQHSSLTGLPPHADLHPSLREG